MSLFAYTGCDERGRHVSGYIEAENPKAARTSLAERSVVAERLSMPDFRSVATVEWRAWLYESLGMLLSAGFPMDRAFSFLAEDADSGREYRGATMAVGGSVMAGESLAAAVESVAGVIPPFERSALEMAGRTGEQGSMLVRLASFMEGERRMREKIRSAFAYPVSILAFALLMLGLMAFAVIPRAASLFPPDAVPRSVAVLSNVAPAIFAALALAAGAVGIFAMRLRREAQGGTAKLRRERALLALPLAGKLATLLWASRYAATMSLLAGSGLTPQDAVAPSGEATGSAMVATAAAAAADEVKSGASLSGAISSIAPFGAMLSPWIAVGEKTGALAEMLAKAAERARYDYERCLQRALGFLEPALIALAGVAVLAVSLAVLKPMLALTTGEAF